MTLQTHLQVIVLQPLFLQELHQTAHLLLQDLILYFHLLDLNLSRWLLDRYQFGSLGLQVIHHGVQSIALTHDRPNLLLAVIHLALQGLDRLSRALQLATHGYQILCQLLYLTLIVRHLRRIHRGCWLLLLQLLSVRIFQALLLPGRFDFDLEQLLLVVILLGFKSVIKIRS